MRIAGSELNLKFSAFEIYVAGCTRQCPGCHNEEAQSFSKGVTWQKWLTMNKYKLKNFLFNNIWILGGDLLCQPRAEEVEEFLRALHRNTPEKTQFWLWTGVEKTEDIPAYIFKYFDWLKVGSYKMDLPSHVVKLPDNLELTLASNNQRLFRVKHGEFLGFPAASWEAMEECEYDESA